MATRIAFRDEPLASHHRIAKFSCGTAALDDQLRLRAAALNAVGHSRTLVAVEPSRERDVIAYATLVPSTLDLRQAPVDQLDRYWQLEVPVVRVTHLAVTTALQGIGIGTELVFAVAMHALELAAVGKALALVVDAPPSRWQATLKQRLGAVALSEQPTLLVVPLATVSTALASV